MTSRQIILLFLIAFFATIFGDDFLDENNLYFDFPYKTAKNWTGLDGWKFVPNNRRGMLLNGPPDTGENYPILVLAPEKATLATLTSPLLSAQKGVSCLHFNYHIRVQNHNDYGLTVSSVKENGEKNTLWAMSRQDYDIWESAQIQIKRNVPIKIHFSGNQNLDGIIALNKFYLHDGKCQNMNNIDCDFESDCQNDWKYGTDPTFSHKILVSKGDEQEYFDQKHEDHTTDSSFGHTAIMVPGKRKTIHYDSPMLFTQMHKCLTFAFMSNSRDIHFYIDRLDGTNWNHQWYSPVNYMLNEWHYIQVPDMFTNTSQYAFCVDNNGDIDTNAIQIDDVKLRSECKPMFDNDFQYGFGQWRSPKSSKHRFRIGKGRVESGNFISNMSEHPIAAYTDFTTTSSGSAMKLLSAWSFEVNVAKCLEFDFLVRNFTSSSKFRLNLIDQNGAEKTFWSYDTDIYKDDVIYENEQVAIPAWSVYYRLEFFVETDNPQMSAAIMRIAVDSTSAYYCFMKKKP